jgi:uncharacterized protein with NAD-binding domain and iron-sulfur cluster
MTTQSSASGPASRKRTRLAIIGGGPSALVAAFHLTRNEPDAYDITVYEMSWRLGGKTVSGRGEHGRIEEHGLHILFGCYHNVFATMLECYDEMNSHELWKQQLMPETGEPGEHWLRHFYDAIEPHHFGVIGDDRPKRWEPLLIEFPSNRGVPGDAPLPGTFDLLSTLFQVTWMALISARSLRILHYLFAPIFDFRNRWKRADFAKHERAKKQRKQRDERSLGGDFSSRLVLLAARNMLDGRRVPGKLLRLAVKLGQLVMRPLRYLTFGFFKGWWAVADFMQALIRGLIEDEVILPGGFERIDAYDLRGWLCKHGAAKDTLGSPWVRVIYDAAFSYPKGGLVPTAEQTKPGEVEGELVAAGAALRALMLMILTYKGAFYNKMRAGMGDVIHVPLYLVLKHRGVKFEFFHRLTDITPKQLPDGSYAIESLQLDTLPNEKAAPYAPLVQVQGLLCWPSLPVLERLPDDACRERARVAESYGVSGAPSRQVQLERGRDFDAVVLGTPVACLPYVCPTLLEVDRSRPNLPQASLSNQFQIDTVQTIAVQLWLKPTLGVLGWRDPSPLLSLFLDPLNTWCDMTHLAEREAWPVHLRAGNIAYFCGALPHQHEFPAPERLADVSGLRGVIRGQVETEARKLLEQQLFQLLPTVQSASGFNYGLLVDPNNGKDALRLEAAYLRANYEPHALCTLALPGKTEYRIKTDGTGYTNLLVTGDWIDNNIHLACVEGAFQSGMRTARAIAARHGGPVDKYVIVAEGLMNLPVTRPTAPSPTALRNSETS